MLKNIKVTHKNPNSGLVVDVWTLPPNQMADLIWFESDSTVNVNPLQICTFTPPLVPSDQEQITAID